MLLLVHSLVCLSSRKCRSFTKSMIYSAIVMICLHVSEKMQRLHLVTSSSERCADVSSVLDLRVSQGGISN